MQLDRERLGPWALVTGASSGIGEAFAHRLAREKLSLVLVARRGDVLESLATVLEKDHGIETRVIAADLARDGAVDVVARETEDLDIGLVVSNAGTGNPGAFAKCDLEVERAIIRLNVTTPMELARVFAPRLVPRKRGGIVFVSSAMAFQGTPYMANYAATKAYVLVLGESLHEELKPSGVDVLVVAPGATETPGKDLHPIDYDRIPVHWMQPEEVVDSALGSLGKRAVVVPGARNHLLACFGSGLWTRRRVGALLGEFARRAIPADRL
jgi:short-subunit dehydrogenase